MTTKTNVPAVHLTPKQQSVMNGALRDTLLSERAIARLEAAAEAVHAQANGGRGFQAVSSKEGFAATIKHGKTLIEIQGDSFAVRQTD